MVMDAERGDEEVNFLQKLGPGLFFPNSAALLGKSKLVCNPIVLGGQRELGGPVPHLLEALGPMSGEARLSVSRAVAQLIEREVAPALHHRLDPVFFFLLPKKKAFLCRSCSKPRFVPRGLVLRIKLSRGVPDVMMCHLVHSQLGLQDRAYLPVGASLEALSAPLQVVHAASDNERTARESRPKPPFSE